MLRDDRAFTLIEVVAAVAVFTIVAIPLTQILIQGDQLAIKAAKNTVALNITQQKMEELIAQGWAAPTNEGTFETNTEGYYGTVNLSPRLGLMQVTVSVTYDSIGKEGLVKLTSLLPEEE